MLSTPLDFEAALEPDSFIGRSDALGKVFDRLKGKGFSSSSIVGGPKTGKTSLLRYIASSQADKLCPQSLRVYIDAEPLGVNAVDTDFWISALRAVQKKAPSDILNKTLDSARDRTLDVYALEDLCDYYAAAQTPLVIAIDNCECLLQNKNFWPPVSAFFHDARSLAQRQPRGIAYVTGTPRPLLDLWDPGRGASPYYNIFLNILVARMTAADIASVVNSVFTAYGVQPNGQCLALVKAASDSHPGLVGRVAQFLAQRIASDEPADEDSLAVLGSDPEGPYVTIARQVRSNLQPAERLLIDSLGQQQLTPSNRLILEQLQQYGLLPPGTEF